MGATKQQARQPTSSFFAVSLKLFPTLFSALSVSSLNSFCRAWSIIWAMVWLVLLLDTGGVDGGPGTSICCILTTGPATSSSLGLPATRARQTNHDNQRTVNRSMREATITSTT